MHEFSLAENILNILHEIKKKEKINKIFLVNIKVGALLHVVPETLKFAFDTIIKDTEFRDAVLNLEIEPIKIKCNNCNETNEVERNNYVCPNCMSEDISIIGTKDFFITSVDAE